MKQVKVGRRTFLTMTGTAGSLAILAACAPAAEAPAAAEDGMTVEAKLLRVNCYTPSEHTERSAENPFVTNAPRILAEAFKEHYPHVEIEWVPFPEVPEGVSGDAFWPTWFTPLIAAGNAPQVVRPLHEIPIQNGWTIPIDDHLTEKNQFAPQYDSWNDSFYPTLMQSLVFGDGKTYCAPVQHPYPGVEVGLAYNQDWLDKIGMDAPATWTEQKEVFQALKEAGSGLSPWPPEAQDGNVWPVALQLLVSMLQDECAVMDTNGDLFVGAEEALPAFRDGIIGPLTDDYRTAWLEFKQLSNTWVDGWATADLDSMWRNGEIGIRTTGAWEFSRQMNDPLITFDRAMIPPPYITDADFPAGNTPPAFTPGDGKVPYDLVTAINGPDTAIIRDAVEQNDSMDEAVAWLQWITEPENNAFLVNENQYGIPATVDAPLGPLFSEVASFKVPQWQYQIAWWGQALYFDNTHFNELRKVFVAWASGQIDDETFFQRQHQETSDGADRYAASLEELKGS